MTDHSSHLAAKPVVALMGEFSAGKSTLANLLLDEQRSPVRVTATQMPPIWYTYGEGAPIRMDLFGTPSALPEDRLSAVSVEDTAYVLVRSRAEILQLMDIIDMPGISDPNLAPESWQRTIHNADAVVWCSHATQAWRQSEAATWNELPEKVRENGILLLTRFDKLLTEKDGQRVLARVESESAGAFRGIYPISLLKAAEAGEDRDGWEHSGAEAFMQALLDMVFDLAVTTRLERPAAAISYRTAMHTSVPEHPEATADDAGVRASSMITPKRVSSNRTPGEASQRPPRSAMQEFLV